MLDGSGGDPFPPGADIHSILSIIQPNGSTLAIPANVGVNPGGSDLANPHTHAADNKLHMHPLNGVDPTNLYTVGDFFSVWRTNAGVAGNNPNAVFNATHLMNVVPDGAHQVVMTVNGEFNNDFENYVMHDDDQIVLSIQPLTNPTLAALEDLRTDTRASLSDPVVAGAPMQVPLDGFDADGDPLTFSVSTSNPALTGTISHNNRSLKISVNHVGTGGSDPSFSGDMVFELFEDRAPRTTARIIELAQDEFYDGVVFHRVIDGFMIQGGDPTGTGSGGTGVDFDDEFNPGLQHTSQGLLSMAKSREDTNDSQFFITDRPLDSSAANPGFARFLDFQHTIFGRLIEGDDIRELISKVPKDGNDKPVSPVTMTNVEVYRDRQNAVLTLTAPNGTTGTSSVTVTATDAHGNSFPRTFQVDIIADTVDNAPFLAPIPTVAVAPGQTANVQLSATDLEGDDIFYLDHDIVLDNFDNEVPIVPNTSTPDPNDLQLLPVNPNLDVEVDLDTGLMKITPKPGVVGMQYTLVGVANAPGEPVDLQQVHVLVLPPALTGISLVASSDQGASNTDRLTHLNNANPNSKLSFTVTGATPGAKVTLYDGNTPIGSAIAGTSTVIIDTNGSTALASGSHSIKARMSFQLDPNFDTGSPTGFVDVPDNLSSTTELIVGNDFHNPLISEDADANGNIQALDVLVIVNYLNANPDPNTPVNSSFYLDVSNEGTVSALDVLQVVNYLNSHPQATGLVGQSLVSQGLIAQSLAAPQEAATDLSFKKADDSSATLDSGLKHVTSAKATTDTDAANSFADSLSISAADVADLDELIELLATAR